MKDSKSYLWNTCFYQKMNSNYIQSLSQWKACKLWVASAIFGGFFYIQTEDKKSEDILFQFTPPPWLYRALRPWQTRTHRCGHIVADTNVSPFARARNICCGHKNGSDFVQKHFVSATNVSQFAQPKKHHGQQCVCNNVSSLPGPL